MPYYCTVPRCTSMAGKAKNVSFHQFPRDEELAKLWNKILKRGKPYTKYSKVCSLHFTPDDYTMTSGQKYKGQWRTLRKDAIPSRNLPTESPIPNQSHASFTPPPTNIDARMHQQMAQAIYVQTMLAMQAAGVTALQSDQSPPSPSDESDESITPPLINTFSQLEQLLTHKAPKAQFNQNGSLNIEVPSNKREDPVTFKCEQCSKCFKDPDVYVLHKRSHVKDEPGNTDDMLRANPILANLLKKSETQQPNDQNNALDLKNVRSIESQIMSALAANMENYLRNLSTIMIHGNTMGAIDNGFDNVTADYQDDNSSNCDTKDLDDSEDSKLVIDEDAS